MLIKFIYFNRHFLVYSLFTWRIFKWDYVVRIESFMIDGMMYNV